MMIWLLVASLAVLTVGAGVCLLWRGSGHGVSRLGAAVSLAGAVLSLGPAGRVLWSGQSIFLRLAWPVPMGNFYLAVDPLTALFISVIAVVCALAAVYGTGYLAVYAGRKHLGSAWCFYNLLFASMLLIVAARNGVLFIMAWEGMSLASFFLVMFEHEEPAVREAGWTYLTAAQLGAACLLAMFALLGGPGADLDFDRLAAPQDPAAAGVLFVLAVAGFGAKAGFLPLHVWLPEAHPAAPSHVSAVMSGVMIKTGIYGVIRIISLLGPPVAWWGWSLLAVGTASGVIGVLLALAQHDLKRLLAYHSVENIGIICLGLGMWLLGTTYGMPELAALGLMGGLLHVCNHSIFKSLLFFGAGAVKHAAHTLDMDRLGGLQKRLPRTALPFLIGAAAICGLPPLNGFVSEFLLFLGAYGAMAHSNVLSGPAVAGLIVLMSLGLIGGLAAACFTKVYGILFLGEPRSSQAAGARETAPAMWLTMWVLAGLCILLGLGAPLGVAWVAPAAGRLLGGQAAAGVTAIALPLLMRISLALGFLVLLALLLGILRSRLLSGRTLGQGPTWDCGYAAPSARMQYTASSFAWPVIGMFRRLVHPQLHVGMDNGLFPQQAQLSSHTDDQFKTLVFAPLFRTFAALALRLHGLQQGRNQIYILYIAITVLCLLLILR